MGADKYFDQIAKYGAGSAHPGGFKETLRMLSTVRFYEGEKILEIGCGTGRTACYLAKKYGAHVTGCDRHPLMVKKAQRRAQIEKSRASFLIGDVYKLPFAAGSFETVLMESVSVFLDTPRAFQEIHRVLKPGGRMINLELFAKRPLSAQAREACFQYYGVRSIPTLEEWSRAIRQSGFAKVVVQRQKSFHVMDNMISEMEHPDPLAQVLIDKNATAMGMNQPIFQFAHHLGYATLIGLK